ncbi:hypothetical protein GCM10009613_31810 [Pseudonocardia kongjuensis]|uniref:HTH luxR-type domain-containing protein n=1 Tax=Pseudonocardia kongjuensis TaxID=102227 RepID=A0ABN1XUS4_9PSEU
MRTDEFESRSAEARSRLETARSEARSGAVDRAWAAALAAARTARELGDAGLLGRAALAVGGPDLAARHLTAARQALCLEAMAALGDTDPELRELVGEHLTAISTAWSVRPAEPVRPVPPDEAERRSIALQARHARALGPAGTGERLAVAGDLVGLGDAAGDDHIRAWGRLWRLDALQQLGLRVEFHTELTELAALVGRLGSPVWRWRLASVHASLALIEDRLDDVGAAIAEARAAGESAGAPDTSFLDLLFRHALAHRTGDGLAAIEAEVRLAVADGPFLAQGWRGRVLLRSGRAAEAVAVWRALAPHAAALPPASAEVLVAEAGHAELAEAAGDRIGAEAVRRRLRPFAHLHVTAGATTPYGGPVALVLGRLARFLGDAPGAAAAFTDAATRADAFYAPWFAAAARDALAGTELVLGPLTRRETEVARLLAEGASNRSAARRLGVSERTVEQHVSSVLRKLGLPNRSAVAGWVIRGRAGR